MNIWQQVIIIAIIIAIFEVIRAAVNGIWHWRESKKIEKMLARVFRGIAESLEIDTFIREQAGWRSSFYFINYFRIDEQVETIHIARSDGTMYSFNFFNEAIDAVGLPHFGMMMKSRDIAPSDRELCKKILAAVRRLTI